MFDQFYWGERLCYLGLSPPSLSLEKLCQTVSTCEKTLYGYLTHGSLLLCEALQFAGFRETYECCEQYRHHVIRDRGINVALEEIRVVGFF